MSNGTAKALALAALLGLAGCGPRYPTTTTGRDLACQAYKRMIAEAAQDPVIFNDTVIVAEAASHMDNLGCAP